MGLRTRCTPRFLHKGGQSTFTSLGQDTETNNCCSIILRAVGWGDCGIQRNDCQYLICDDWIEGVFSLYENRRSGNVALSRFHALLISCELESETCRQGPGPSLAGAEAAEDARRQPKTRRYSLPDRQILTSLSSHKKRLPFLVSGPVHRKRVINAAWRKVCANHDLRIISAKFVKLDDTTKG
jgi:hypothetical protein